MTKQIFYETSIEYQSRLRHQIFRLLAGLARIGEMTCGCQSSTQVDWHHDKCWKKVALDTIQEHKKLESV